MTRAGSGRRDAAERLRRAGGRIPLTTAERWLRRTWYGLRPRTVRSGVAAGLRFDPGPAARGYGRGNDELPVQEALRDLLSPGWTVFDVGANVGFLTIVAAHLVGPTGTVVAFEPVPENARYVRRNAQLNGLRNVSVVERAVSDRTGSGRLVLADHAGGAALDVAPRPPDATHPIEVEIVTIDDAVARDRLGPPDLVKIDVEGAELELLEGMAATAREHRPTVLCEIDDGDPDRFRRKVEACTEQLRSWDYDVRTLAPSYSGPWLVAHLVAESPDSSHR